MRAWISRFLDVRQGEGIALAQAFFTLFGLIAAHTILETARDALFLTKLPVNRLTVVYALLAGLALIGAALNTRLVRAFGRRNALVFTLLIAAYGTTMIYFWDQSPAAIFGLYLWSGFLGTVMVIQFWMFAGTLFTIAQSKRLFGPVASGGVLGAVAGATAAMFALKFLDVTTLLLAASGLFLLTAGLLTIGTPDESKAPVNAPPPAVAPMLDLKPAGLFKKHPYLVRLALLAAISTAALLATDYLFKSVLAETQKIENLGEFLARYYAVLNAIALVVQVGIAGRIVRRQGVFVASTVLPTLLFFGSAGLLLFGGRLLLVLLTKGADGSLRHSLHRVANELFWMPVPAEARDRGKAFIDGVVVRGASALIAGLIFGLSTMGWATPRILAILVLGLVFAWLSVAVSLRVPYLDLIRSALRKGIMLDDSDLPSELDLDSVEAVLESLSSREPERVIAAMDLLAERKRSRLIPALVLYHESDDVLVRALEIMSAKPKGNERPREDWVPLAERLMSHGSERVRVAAIRAFVGGDRKDLVKRGLSDPSVAVRAHAAFCMARSEEGLDPQQAEEIRAVVALGGEEGRVASLALLDAIRDHGDARFTDLVVKISATDDPEIIERAATTMASLADPRFIPTLVDRLKLRDGRGAVRDALVHLGDPALDAVEKALFDPATDPKIRLHLPRTISRFGTQRAADILMRALTGNFPGMVRYKVLRGLNRMIVEHDLRTDRAVIDKEIQRNLAEHLRMLGIRIPLETYKNTIAEDVRDSAELVIGLVKDKETHALERAFRLLQIKHRHEDIRRVYLALSSKDKRVRASAQEFIDVVTIPAPADRNNRLEIENREMWRIAIDDLADSDRLLRTEEYMPAPATSYSSALSRLVHDPDEYLASLASYHALEIGEEKLRDEVIEVYEQRPSLRVILQQATQIPRLALGGA